MNSSIDVVKKTGLVHPSPPNPFLKHSHCSLKCSEKKLNLNSRLTMY